MRKQEYLTWAFAVGIIVFAVAPMLWLLRLSVTPEAQIHDWPPRLMPEQITIGHYLDIIGDPRFWWQLANTLMICFAATCLALTLGALGAYGLARRKFRGRDLILTSCLLLHLVPGVASMAAIYRAAELLHAFDSLLFVALIKSGGVTFALMILMAAFKKVPEKLEYAAQVDGLSRRRVLLHVTLPLAGPGILAAGLLLFIQSWNTFFLPYLLLEKPGKMTLTVGLYRYFSEHGFQQGHVAAFMILSVLPVLILFAIFRRKLWRDIEV